MKKTKPIIAVLVAGMLSGEREIPERIPYIYVPVPEKFIPTDGEEVSIDDSPVFKLWKFAFVKEIGKDKLLYELEKIEM